MRHNTKRLLLAGAPVHLSASASFDGLSSYWKMEESGSSDRVDSIGSDDLTANEAITTIAGINNNAANFDAETHSLISTTWRATDVYALSISVWIKRQANVTESSAIYLAENSGASPAFICQCSGTGTVAFSVRNAATETEIAGPTEDAGYDTDWINIVNTWSSGNTVRIYRNGALWGESPGTLTGPLIDHTSGIIFSGLPGGGQ